MKLLKISALTLALMAGACSSDDNGDSCNKIYGYCYSTTGDVTVAGSDVSGTGQVNFGQIADSTQAGKNFKVSVSLEDTNSVTLNAFADSTLANGVNIVFTRQGSKLAWTIGSETGTVITASEADADASAALTINVDIHNDEGHIFIWEGTASIEGADEEAFEIELDSAGTGTSAGLNLSGAIVSNFVVGDVVVEH